MANVETTTFVKTPTTPEPLLRERKKYLHQFDGFGWKKRLITFLDDEYGDPEKGQATYSNWAYATRQKLDQIIKLATTSKEKAEGEALDQFLAQADLSAADLQMPENYRKELIEEGLKNLGIEEVATEIRRVLAQVRVITAKNYAQLSTVLGKTSFDSLLADIIRQRAYAREGAEYELSENPLINKIKDPVFIELELVEYLLQIKKTKEMVEQTVDIAIAKAQQKLAEAQGKVA